MAFELFQSKNNQQYYFRLSAKNGAILLQSESYSDKSSAANGIQSILQQVAQLENFEEAMAKNGQRYFILKDEAGEILARSEGYNNRSGYDHGIQAVQKIAPTASIKDLTIT
ncbi:MAG: YegP family protein [Saprospiraceae bacterium]